ncbi:VOC family protein [Methylobacterium sp. WL103]|uniref:VOC family protein n=1 Tax=unclassified Methylobacterium TaxID=2615210 RepID=UPI0011C867C0|nr:MULTISPECIES: VOC family protein [unclassified Methylobacterium]TXM74292.1 VOC family protein [Methylobacterium sp. WL12]TXM92417.1 VOC family protein [Methylobacterium sp. WL103]
MADHAGTFVWYELTTPDVAAAQAFYGAVAGWAIVDAGMPGIDYRLATVGDVRICGMMASAGCEAPAGTRHGWLGYVGVADVDASAERVTAAGGRITFAPRDIPGVGRFCMAADPQGAAFALFRGDGPPPPMPPRGTPGPFAWHELHARDWEPAFAFYAGLFGWETSMAVDMGPMGTYQVFARYGVDLGGMMSAPLPTAPSWLFYIAVEAIDAAAERVAAAGGTVLQGPHPVPGGDWIVQAQDPQGTPFALVGPKPAA